MKILSILIVVLFSSLSLIGQEKMLQLTHKNGKKVRVLKENKKILARTFDGEKYKGRFQIDDYEHIIIDGKRIALNSIELIKRKPLAIRVVKGVFLIVGTYFIGVGILANDTLSSAVGISTGILTNLFGLAVPEFFSTSRYSPKWSFEIIEVLN